MAFLYVAAPNKIGRHNAYSGTVDFSNQNTDEFLAALKKSGVRYMDLRDAIEENGLIQHKLFYRTDHHWLAETGWWTASLIAKYLDETNIVHSDRSLLCIDRYKQEIYKDWFLGSHGKKVTLAKTRPEDISLLYPKFETEFHYIVPDFSVDVIGDFSIIYDMCRIEEKNYYEKNPYGAYNYGDHPYIRIENRLLDNESKILLIKDSFGNSVAPFLALNCQVLDVQDLRHFTGSVKTFISKTRPTAVIVLYQNAELNARMEITTPGGRAYIFR